MASHWIEASHVVISAALAHHKYAGTIEAKRSRDSSDKLWHIRRQVRPKKPCRSSCRRALDLIGAHRQRKVSRVDDCLYINTSLRCLYNISHHRGYDSLLASNTKRNTDCKQRSCCLPAHRIDPDRQSMRASCAFR